jgi:hypothetical protein
MGTTGLVISLTDGAGRCVAASKCNYLSATDAEFLTAALVS